MHSNPETCHTNPLETLAARLRPNGLPDPLAHPEAVRIPLGPEQSEVIAALGSVFVVIARESYPGDPRRMQLIALPCPLDVARAAESVALGKARAVKLKPASVESGARTVSPAQGDKAPPEYRRKLSSEPSC